jgi:hypothetical protein
VLWHLPHAKHRGSDIVITAAADQITLVDYDNTAHPLAASDFLFA